MTVYVYHIKGTAADKQTWEAFGQVEVPGPGHFKEALDLAMKDCFMQVTDGLAEYGRPGVGCKGPYSIRTFYIMEKQI